MYGLLDAAGIPYEREKRLASKKYGVVKSYDIYFPATDTYVELHGTFWHADPSIYFDTAKLTPVQRHNLRNDLVKEDIVKSEHSRRLFIVWEREVAESPAAVSACLRAWATRAPVL